MTLLLLLMMLEILMKVTREKRTEVIVVQGGFIFEHFADGQVAQLVAADVADWPSGCAAGELIDPGRGPLDVPSPLLSVPSSLSVRPSIHLSESRAVFSYEQAKNAWTLLSSDGGDRRPAGRASEANASRGGIRRCSNCRAQEAASTSSTTRSLFEVEARGP